MPLSQPEILLYKSAEISDASSNGGRMSSVPVVSGLAANMYPRAGLSERNAGSIKYRKVFYKAAAADDSPYVNALVFLENYTQGGDRVVLWPANQTDTQNDITGSEQRYGCGQLNTTVGAGVTSIQVDVEDWSEDPIFADSMYIRISDKADMESAGNEEIVQINAVPSPSGDTITLNFTPALASGYSSSDTRVASVIDAGALFGDIEPSFDAFSVSSAGSGAYDDTGNPLGLNSIPTVEENWTLTFTSATAFDIVGDTLGSVGSGNTSGGAAPNNADFSAPYFTLESAGFSGVYQIGDTISFSTHPAAIPLWTKRVIPAGTASQSGNKAVVATSGEG